MLLKTATRLRRPYDHATFVRKSRDRMDVAVASQF